MMKECVFCKIVCKEINSSIIYETQNVVCLLDIHPIAKGHCLIIPKGHYVNIFEIPEEDLDNIIRAAKKISKIVKTELGATGINILHASGKDAQQSVSHFHIHLVPRYKNDGLNAWPSSDYKEKSFEKIRQRISLSNSKFYK